MAEDLNPYTPSAHPSSIASSRPLPSRLAPAQLPYRSIGGWTRLIQFLLIVTVGLNIATIVLSVGGVDQVQNVHRSSADARGLVQTGASMSLLAFGMIVVFVLMGLALVAWIYKAYANLPALDADQPRFSPSVALLICFIPVLNFVTTYFVLAEIWRESDPRPLNPSGTNRGSGTVVTIWWLATLLGVGSAMLLSWAASQADEPPELSFAFTVSIMHNGLVVFHRVLLLWIVGEVFANQEARRTLVLFPPKSIALSRVPEFPEEPRPISTE